MVKQQIDGPGPNEVQKLVAPPAHAKRVGQGQRDKTLGLMSDRRGLDEGILGVDRIPQIPFKIDDGRGGNRSGMMS